MSCNLQLVETCSVFLCIVLHRCYCISIIVILSTVFRTSHRCINAFLPQKIKKNFCFAIPVCIRTEFNLRNHKSNYIPQSLLPFTLRVVSTRIFKEDLTFNVETKT